MKLNNLSIFGLMFLLSCSRPQKTILSKINIEDDMIVTTDRSIATTDEEFRCLSSLFTEEMLKKEVKKAEKKFENGTVVTGTWKHLDLSKLPIPQANFLKSYGKKLGDISYPNSIDYSSCEDVPCIINKIYGKKESKAGYVHYLWYLKYNQYLSVSNYIHSSTEAPGTYNGKDFPLSAYLYNGNEIYAWWRLLQMNDQPFFELKTLREIHRLPRGESFDFTEKERRAIEEENRRLRAAGKEEKPMPWGETCGVAYSNGYIVLQDLCLRLDGDLESGSFYTSVTHEISHHVDYTQGLKMGRAYRSTDTDYYSLAGFEVEEYVDDNGRVKKKWKHKPDIKLVTNYSGTTPMENFAETLSYFRHDGELTSSKVSEEHFEWVSDKYYNSNSFNSNKLILNWLDDLTMETSQFAFKSIPECLNAKSGTLKPIYSTSEFSTRLSPTTLSCLSNMTVELSRNLQSKIRLSKPEGCHEIMRPYFKDQWYKQLKDRLVVIINEYLDDMQKNPAYIAKMEVFIQNLNKNDLSNKAFLYCYLSENEEQCYNDQIFKLVDEQLISLNMTEDKLKYMANLYLMSHSYKDSQNQVMSSYSKFVASNLELISTQAKSFWNECVSKPISDEEIPNGNLFSTGEGYMVSSMYNCLNSTFKEKTNLIVGQYSLGGLKVNHPSEELILKDFTSAELKRILFEIYMKEAASEKVKAISYIKTAQTELRTLVLADFSWVKNILNQESIANDCLSFIVSKITFPMRFYVKAKFFKDSIQNNICSNIQSSTQFTQWLETLSSSVSAKAQGDLESRILILAGNKAKSCLKDFPNDTQLNRVKFRTQRESCLIESWIQLEDEAAKQLQEDPLIIKFEIDVTKLKKAAIDSRRKLQIKAIKENF